MPKKKSIKRSARQFVEESTEIVGWAEHGVFGAEGDRFESWANEYAILRLARACERLMLEVLTGAINNDTEVLSLNTGIRFPKHLTDEVCEFLIQGTGYFDFHGRGGLIKTLQQYVPKTHYLVGILKKPKYRASLDRLTALRNYAAHDSASARSGALKAVGNKKMASPGSWLKRRVGLGCWQKT